MTYPDTHVRTKAPADGEISLDWPKGLVWEAIENVIPLTRRVLLYGPPGTGKTHIAVHGNLADGEQVFAKTLTQEMTSHELLGTWMPMPDEETGGQRFVWVDGPAVKAWRLSHSKPVRLVLNEIDRAGPDIQSILYVLVDDLQTACVTLPTGETIRPGKHFRCIASMNGEPADLPPALEDRFAVRFYVNEVNPGALDILPDYLRSLAAETAITVDPSRRVSIRAWLALYELLAKGCDDEIAARAVFGNRWMDLLTSLRIARATKEESDAFSALDDALKGGE